MKDFKNKVVWITGASSGIGEALVYEFDKEGAILVLSARRKEELERVQKNLKNAESFILPLDLDKTESIKPAAEEILAKYGKVDVLVNNGGISQRSLAKETNIEVDKKIMNINFIGQVAATKAVLPSMIKNKSGHIIVTSSLVGKFGTPLRSTYSASKHALHGFFDSLRAEVFDDNIEVTIVCPGFIRTQVSVNALTGDGSKQNKMDETTGAGMSAEECAKQIVKAVKKGKFEVAIGGKETFGILLKRLLPTTFANFIRKAKVT